MPFSIKPFVNATESYLYPCLSLSMDFNSSFVCVKVVGFDVGLVNSAKVPFFPGIFSRPVVRVFIVFVVVSIHSSSSSSSSSSSTKAASRVWPYPTTAILYRQLVGWSLTTFHRRRLFASYFFVFVFFFFIIIIFFVVLYYVASLCF